ncbi:MAG: hypothetical protein ACKO7W_21930 [Elainella sp.]
MPLELLLNPERLQNHSADKLSQEFTSESHQIQDLIQSGELTLSPDVAPGREPIRHLLYGSPEAVRRTILLLHQLGYAEPGLWSRLQPTSTPGQVMSVLVRYLRLE